MKLRLTLVVFSCLLSVVLGIVLSQQRLGKEIEARIAEQVKAEVERVRGDVAGTRPATGEPARVAISPEALIEEVRVEIAKSTAATPGGAAAGPATPVPRVPEGKKVLIALSMDTLQEERWQGDRDMFVARCKELGADVEVLDANSDDSRQIQQVKSLLTKNPAALVIIPHDGAVMAEGVRLAHEKGIRVLAYDRIIKNCDLDLYATFDNVRVGEMQGRFVALHATKSGGGKKRAVRIYGSETDNNAFLFKQGQDNMLNPLIAQGLLEVVHEQHAHDWKPENAKKITEAALVKSRALDYVVASNDGTAGGAIQALTEAGLAGKVIVTGQDAELVACQRIANGTQAMTIYKPLSRLARRAAELAVGLANGDPITSAARVNNGKIEVPSELLEVVLVTKGNLRDTVIKDGFLKEAQVFAK